MVLYDIDQVYIVLIKKFFQLALTVSHMKTVKDTTYWDYAGQIVKVDTCKTIVQQHADFVAAKTEAVIVVNMYQWDFVEM